MSVLLPPLAPSGRSMSDPSPKVVARQERRISMSKETVAKDRHPSTNVHRKSVPGATRGLSSIQLRALTAVIATADLDQNGRIDMDQLQQLLNEMGYTPSQMDVALLMAYLDGDGDGMITAEDMRKPSMIEVIRSAPRMALGGAGVSKGWKGTEVSKESPSRRSSLGSAISEEAVSGPVILMRRSSVANSFSALRSPSIAVPDYTPTTRRQSNMMQAAGVTDNQLQSLFDRIHVKESHAIAALMALKMGVDQLTECSYQSHDLNFILAQAGISRESKRRLVQELEMQRNSRVLASRQAALIIQISRYTDQRVVRPSHAELDGEAVADGFLRLGYAVHYMRSTSSCSTEVPFKDHIYDYIRTMGALLQLSPAKTKAESPAVVQIVIYLLGNAMLVDTPGDGAEWCLMAEDWSPDRPQEGLIPIQSLTAAFPRGTSLFIMADFANVYHMQAATRQPSARRTRSPRKSPRTYPYVSSGRPLPPLFNKDDLTHRKTTFLDKGAAVLYRNEALERFEQPSGGGVFTDVFLSSTVTSSSSISTLSVTHATSNALQPWVLRNEVHAYVDEERANSPALPHQLAEEGISELIPFTQLSLGCLLPLPPETVQSTAATSGQLLMEASNRIGLDSSSRNATPTSFLSLMDHLAKVIHSHYTTAGDAAELGFWESYRAALTAIQVAVQGDGPDVQLLGVSNTRNLAILLQGDVRQAFASGAVDHLQKEVDTLVGCPNTLFEFRTLGKVKEHFNKMVKLQQAQREMDRFRGPGGGGGARFRRPGDGDHELEFLEHDPVLLLISLPLPMASSLQQEAKVDKRKGSKCGRRASVILGQLTPNEVKDVEAQSKDMMDKWDHMKHHIAQIIESGRSHIMGLHPTDVLGYHEVSVQCTKEQCRSLVARLKDGRLWQEKVVAIHRKALTLSGNPRPGVLAAVGHHLLANIRRVLAVKNDIALQRECRIPIRSFKPLTPPNGGRVDVRRPSSNSPPSNGTGTTQRRSTKSENLAELRVKRVTHGSSLQAVFKHCTPGDTMEIEAGVWSGPLTLDQSFITLKAIGEVIITSNTDAPAIIIQASCRLQGLRITSKGQHSPALLVEQGDPEILDCIISGQHGCVRALSRTGMLIKGCHLHGTISIAAALVMDHATGQIVDCEISENIMGINVIGPSAQPLIKDCVIRNNKGAGLIVEQQARVRMIGTAVSGNACPGVLVEDFGHALIYRCFIHHNKAGGVTILNNGTVDVQCCEFSGNEETEMAVSATNNIVQICRNKFFRDQRHWKASEVAITLQDASVLIEDNDFDGYVNAIASRGKVNKSVVQLNRAVGSADGEGAFVKYSGHSGEPFERGGVRYNDWYPASGLTLNEDSQDQLGVPADSNGDYYDWNLLSHGSKSPGSSNRTCSLASLTFTDCVLCGYYACFRSLLRDGSVLNQSSASSSLPLLASVRRGDSAMVRLLLQAKATPNRLSADGWGPLHAALHAHDDDLVSLFLQHEARPSMPMSDGRTPAFIALETQYLKGLRNLLEQHAVDVNAIINMPSQGKATLAYYATTKKDFDALELLVEFKADLDIPEEVTRSTPLYTAVRHRSVEVVEWLLEHKVMVDAPTKEGDRTLFCAIRNKDIDLVQLLLSEKADLHAVTADGSTALHLAVEGDVADILQVLLTSGADVAVATKSGQTLMHCAVQWQSVACIPILLAYGAPTSLPNKWGLLPVNYGSADVVRLLNGRLADFLQLCRDVDEFSALQKEVDQCLDLLNSSNDLGVPPMLMSVLFGNKKAVGHLLSAGATVAWRDTMSVLMWPCMNHSESMVGLLTRSRHHPTTRDHEALNLLDRACRNEESTAIIRYSYHSLLSMSKEATKRQQLFIPHTCIPSMNYGVLARRMNEALENLRYAREEDPLPEDNNDEAILPRDDFGTTILSYLSWLPVKTRGAIDKHEVETWIWNARWFTINKIVDGCSLPVSSIFKLCLYSMDTALFTQTTRMEKYMPLAPPSSAEVPPPHIPSPSHRKLSIWSPLPDLLFPAILDLPIHEGICYVYSSVIDEPFHVDTEVICPITLWATVDVHVIRALVSEDAGTMLIITSVTGRRLSGHGVHEQNQEVLFVRGTVFQVKAVHECPSPKWFDWRSELAAAAGIPGRLPKKIVEVLDCGAVIQKEDQQTPISRRVRHPAK